MNQYLKSLWLTETVRLIEKESGRFSDEDANRQASSIDGDLSDRIIQRAMVISDRNGLKEAQSDWLNSVKVSMIILCIISLFTGAGLAFSALAQNPVNLYWALLCLLGVHFVTLCLWGISCLFLPNESGSIFIHAWLWLAKKLSRKTTISQLLPAFITLFGKQIRWLIGLIVNLFWSVILFSALVVLVILLSTKHYSFEWQTTLLSADAIISITRLLGEIPSLLGFSLPNADMIRSSEQALSNGEIRSAWAVWLLGIFIVYGIAVRVMLLIFCWLKWVVACQRISLNTQYPEYQRLIHDLEPIPLKSITDKERDDRHFGTAFEPFSHVIGHKKWLVAIDVENSWLAPAQIAFLGLLNNSEQRSNTLDFLQQNPAEKLLIAIDTNRSPDRGMINLINGLMKKSTQTKVWFINQGRQYNNWLESLQKLNIEQVDSTWLLE